MNAFTLLTCLLVTQSNNDLHSLSQPTPRINTPELSGVLGHLSTALTLTNPNDSDISKKSYKFFNLFSNAIQDYQVSKGLPFSCCSLTSPYRLSPSSSLIGAFFVPDLMKRLQKKNSMQISNSSSSSQCLILFSLSWHGKNVLLR